ncbi:hypothetical protein SLEP1_g19252 [Rubroshorea leprosula]|nr:hypothetical protein SLEP1_g19252 [Rubroshorea leprosula]
MSRYSGVPAPSSTQLGFSSLERWRKQQLWSPLALSLRQFCGFWQLD